MPRVRPEPEAGKVQAPEMVRALQQRMGTRQSHITPTMGAEIQPVVVVEDLTNTVQRLPVVFQCFKNNIQTAGGPLQWLLFNPIGSGKMMHVRRSWMSPQHGNIINYVTAAITTPPGTVKRGTAISAGTTMPNDLTPRQRTVAGIITLEGAVVGLATFFEQLLPDGFTVPASLPYHEMQWKDLYLGPGSEFVMYQDITPAGVEFLGGFEWEEVPLV